MLTLIFIFLAIISIFVLVLGKYLYFIFHPNETKENILKLKGLGLENGSDGNSGKNGILNTTTPVILNGLYGNHGNLGKHGKDITKPGSKGGPGGKGNNGPHSYGGPVGLPGIPSNSIPDVITSFSVDITGRTPEVIESFFSYNNIEYKLTSSFLFKDLTYFSIDKGSNDQLYTVDMSSFGNNVFTIPSSESIFKLPNNATNAGQYVTYFSNIRILIESDEIIYVSSPICKQTTLLSLLFNLNSMYRNGPSEIKVNANREFGMDFSVINSDQQTYNYVSNGFSQYAVVFNIEPPIDDLIIRIEEQYSRNVIYNDTIAISKLPSKSNVFKLSNSLTIPDPPNPDIVPGSSENIYLISPKFNTGNVIVKDVSNSSNMWEITSLQNLDEIEETQDTFLFRGLSILDEQNLIFSSNNNIATSIQILSDYSSDISSNMIIQNVEDITKVYGSSSFFNTKKSNLEYNFENARTSLVTFLQNNNPSDYVNFTTFSNQTNADTLALDLQLRSLYNDILSSGDNVNGGDLYLSRIEIDSLNIIYPIPDISVDIPSNLKDKKMYMEFIIEIDISNIDNMIRDIFTCKNTDSTFNIDSNEYYVTQTRDTKGFIIWPYFGSSLISPITPNLPENNINSSSVYYKIVIDNINPDYFKNIYGKKVIFNFSNSILTLDSRFSGNSGVSYTVSNSPLEIISFSGYENPFENTNNLNGNEKLFNQFINVAPTTTSGTKAFVKQKNARYSNFEGKDNSSDKYAGFNFTSIIDKYSVANNIFKIGYKDELGNIHTENVLGIKLSNGDYSVPIELTIF